MDNRQSAAGLAKVHAELDAWRGRRNRGDRIPASIWRHAAHAVPEHGLNAVSQALRLNYYQLKRWAQRTPTRPGVKRGPVFVEMPAQTGAEEARSETALTCVVELEKGNGTRMRICVRDTVAVDWGKLKEAFLGA